jgi:hypothetical protein
VAASKAVVANPNDKASTRDMHKAVDDIVKLVGDIQDALGSRLRIGP